MKKVFFLILLYSFVSVSCNKTPKAGDTKINDFVGKWSYSAEDETLTLDLELTKDNGIVGKYCNIACNGNRIDCSPEDEKNVTGVFKTDTLYLKFSGFYDESARGEAKLYKENDSCIVWILGENKGMFYLPEKATLKKPSLKQENNPDCNDKLSLLITSSSNYVTQEDRNELKAVIDRHDDNEYYVRVYNESTEKDVSLIKLNIETRTLTDYTDGYDEKVLEYETAFYDSVISCFGLKVVAARTEEKEVDPELIKKFEEYYNRAPLYKIYTENEEGMEDEGSISLDMCRFFDITAINLWLQKIPTNYAIKVCLLSSQKDQDKYATFLYTLTDTNRIIDRLLIGGFLDQEGVIKEYYIDDENVIHTDKTDGQKVFDKKKYRIAPTGKIE
ncbi:MAG: hypothetical protein LIP00_09680, partial [Parabacteroides sp.]|nr:hypothetical protein [Parabacteroides sp.]